MRINGLESNEEILAEMGQRLRNARITASLTRDDLAHKSGVSVRTVANIESGRGATFENIINIMRALRLLGNLEGLLPETGPRPSDLAALGKQRQRASRSRGFTWGDLKGAETAEGEPTRGSWREAQAFIWEEDK